MRKSMAALLGVAGALGALAAREQWQRRQDQQHIEAGRDYWRLYLAAADVRWADEHAQTYRIPSGELGIHLDVYARSEGDAPVIVLAHGMLTYGKLYLPLVRSFYARGYTVVSPDFPGNGFSGGVRGGNTVGETAAALVETTLWARQRFDGALYLLGMSLGGALAYAAAAAGAPVSAISCVDLFTFDDPTALRRLVARPGLVDWLPAARFIAAPLGWVRLPMRFVHRMQQIVAPEEVTQFDVWRYDPLVPQTISLRALVSAAATPPAVPLERNKVPTLVINQGDDQVLDPAVTRASYERLSGPKRYIELDGSAHWSFAADFWEHVVDESDAWFREHRAGTLTPPIARAGAGR